MASETWCIVHAHGVMRAEVSQTVATGHLAALSEWHGWRAVRVGDGPYLAATEAMGDSAEEACARLAVGNGLAVREILAPGEPTRAELRAQVEAYAAQLAPMTRAEAARLRAAAQDLLDADADVPLGETVSVEAINRHARKVLARKALVALLARDP